eukprot:scaffold94297_cov43-Prasinocladus_malaysianus.AAC.1
MATWLSWGALPRTCRWPWETPRACGPCRSAAWGCTTSRWSTSSWTPCGRSHTTSGTPSPAKMPRYPSHYLEAHTHGALVRIVRRLNDAGGIWPYYISPSL